MQKKNTKTGKTNKQKIHTMFYRCCCLIKQINTAISDRLLVDKRNKLFSQFKLV